MADKLGQATIGLQALEESDFKFAPPASPSIRVFFVKGSTILLAMEVRI
jgi:hypothetical protein